MNKIKDYAELTRFNRPIGSLLLLWPTLWALWLAADGLPEWHLIVIFVLGVFSMRSAGCVINDYADRKVDGHVANSVAGGVDECGLMHAKLNGRAAFDFYINGRQAGSICLIANNNSAPLLL